MGMTGLDRALTFSMLIENAWRASPAATAVKWSFRGERWDRKPHLTLISDLVKRSLYEPLRLIVSIPPRHGKTELISYWTPIWYLANNPTHRIGLITHAASFAQGIGRKVRDTIISTPELDIEVRGDMRSAEHFGLTHGGYMMSTGVGGPMTGHGYNLIVVDDPVKSHADAYSETARNRMWEWWTSTARTRLEPSGSIVVLMTRWHEDDIVGRMLNDQFGETYQHVNLPAIAEDPNDPLGRAEGQALWPERYDEEHLLNIIKPTVGPMVWAGLYQQRPAPRTGGLFTNKWEVVNAVPSGGQTVRGWDLAATSQGGDYTVGLKMTLVDGIYYIEDIVRVRESASEVERIILQTASTDGYAVIQDIPQDPGQAGKAQIRYLARQLAGYSVMFSPETGPKEVRAYPVSAQAGAGNIKLVRGDWDRNAFTEEAAMFPLGAHDDQVDAMSRAFHRLTNHRVESIGLPEYIPIDSAPVTESMGVNY